MKYIVKTTTTFESEEGKNAFRDKEIATMEADVTAGTLTSWNMDVTVSVDDTDREEYKSAGKEQAQHQPMN